MLLVTQKPGTQQPLPTTGVPCSWQTAFNGWPSRQSPQRCPGPSCACRPPAAEGSARSEIGSRAALRRPWSRCRQRSIDQCAVTLSELVGNDVLLNDTHILSRAAPTEKYQVCFCKICFLSGKLHFICEVLCIWDFSIHPFNLPFEEGRDLIFKGIFVA